MFKKARCLQKNLLTEIWRRELLFQNNKIAELLKIVI